MKPVIARVAIYEGQCSCCRAQTKPACVPEGCEPGSPFSLKTGAPALYLRFTQTTSYRRLVRLFRDLFGLALGAGPIDAMLGRAKPGFDAELAAVLAQLRKLRLVYSDETGVRLAGKGGWNWVFGNTRLRSTSLAGAGTTGSPKRDGQGPTIWASKLLGSQHGHPRFQFRAGPQATRTGAATISPPLR